MTLKEVQEAVDRLLALAKQGEYKTSYEGTYQIRKIIKDGEIALGCLLQQKEEDNED